MKKFLVIMCCIAGLSFATAEVTAQRTVGNPSGEKQAEKKKKKSVKKADTGVIGVVVGVTKTKSGKKNHNGYSSNSVNTKNSPVNTGEIEKTKREIEFLKGDRDWMKRHLTWQDKVTKSLQEKKKSKMQLEIDALKKKKVDGNVTAENFSNYDNWGWVLFAFILIFLDSLIDKILIIVNGQRDKTRNDTLDRLNLENEERKEREKASGTT